MKKNVHKFWALILTCGLLLSCIGTHPVAAESGDPEAGIPEEVRLAMAMQEPALEAYQKLLTHFETNEQGMPVYPAEYGGEYISGDKLVLQLVNRTPALETKYLNWCEDDEHVVFEDADYSLSYLEGLDSVARSLCGQYDIVGYGVDRRNNEYYIEVAQEDYASLQSARSASRLTAQTSLPIRIEMGERGQACVSMYGGDKITNSAGGSFSVCIGGTYNGKPALLTAGHGNEGNPSFSYGNISIGRVAYQRANADSDKILTGSADSLGDFAIVTLNSNATPTNIVRSSPMTVPITGTYSSLPVGATIYKYGFQTGYSWGTVQRANVTESYKGDELGEVYYVRGLYGSTMQNASSTDAVDKGDSGGSVFIKSGSSYLIHGGMASFKEENNAANRWMYSSPIAYATYVGFTPKLS